VTERPLIQKSWSELEPLEVYAIAKLRTDVFFVEQRVDEEELDWRDVEPTTVHLFLCEGRDVVAYLRVLRDEVAEHGGAHRVVGRVVVDRAHRGSGLARLLLARAIELFGDEPMLLHAQSYIAPLYAGAGFEAFGDEYVEAGIPHISMIRPGLR
jgi:ElaA protein